MARPTPTTRTHRMTHNQPRQQPHRNPSPRSKPRTAPPRQQDRGRQGFRIKPAGGHTPAASPRVPKPDSETKDSRTPYQASRRPRPRTTEASHTPALTPRPGAPGCRYYSSSEMYPLATRRAYSLSINISSGDLMLHSTKERHPPGLIPTPCGETYRAS